MVLTLSVYLPVYQQHSPIYSIYLQCISIPIYIYISISIYPSIFINGNVYSGFVKKKIVSVIKNTYCKDKKYNNRHNNYVPLQYK